MRMPRAPESHADDTPDRETPSASMRVPWEPRRKSGPENTCLPKHKAPILCLGRNFKNLYLRAKRISFLNEIQRIQNISCRFGECHRKISHLFKGIVTIQNICTKEFDFEMIPSISRPLLIVFVDVFPRCLGGGLFLLGKITRTQGLTFGRGGLYIWVGIPIPKLFYRQRYSPKKGINLKVSKIRSFKEY